MNSLFSVSVSLSQSLGGLANIWSMMRNSCLALSNPSGEEKANGEVLLEVRKSDTKNTHSDTYKHMQYS